MNPINLMVLLDKLVSMVENAPEIPLTGRALVEPDQMLEVIDKVRSAIPEDLKRAEVLANEKGRVIAEGQQKAERMVAQAEEYAAKLVSESEIMRQAKLQAKEMVDQAAAEAEKMHEGAASYAEQVLNDLQRSLEETLKEVVNGKNELKKLDHQQEL